MGRFRDFAARKLPVTKARIGSDQRHTIEGDNAVHRNEAGQTFGRCCQTNGTFSAEPSDASSWFEASISRSWTKART